MIQVAEFFQQSHGQIFLIIFPILQIKTPRHKPNIYKHSNLQLFLIGLLKIHSPHSPWDKIQFLRKLSQVLIPRASFPVLPYCNYVRHTAALLNCSSETARESMLLIPRSHALCLNNGNVIV